MANYRIRTRYRDSGIIRVNPYVKTRKSFTASYRLHYLNEFCKFVGREKELVELNKFCSADKELLWWSLVGKGGIGKSRLVYQWLKQLSNNWFGFFAKTDVDVERYREFKPFSDTVIVIDYVLGNEDNLCVSQAPEIICAYEMEVWKDIGIVLTDRGELDRLYTLGLRSADYITDRLDNDVVCECIEEVWDAFFIGVHNAELTQQTANLMDKYNQIADKIAENGYIATWCTENYARLMLLWLRRNDYRSAANCWKQMMKFQQRFADDEDILKAIAGAADALYDIYRENQVPGRRCKLLKDMERIFDETHNADVANALAILEANEHTIYDPPAVFDSNKSEILLSTENKLKEIYEAFPNEGKVVLGYSYLVSWNYVTWLDFPRPIDEELIPLFKKWIRKFPENKLELMEYYSFILFEKWLYMDSLDNISEANKIYYEIKAIADELSKDYADNQVTQMLSMGIVRKL